jgi:zinc protease
VIGFYNLPLDYLEQFNEKINAVTLADVKTAFKKRVHPDKMLTVMVGGQTAKTE